MSSGLVHCPPDLRVVVAPLDVELSRHDVVQPDVVVARADDFGSRSLTAPPLLVVEVLSPSTRRADVLGKKDTYEAAGIPGYWIVDPEGPRVMVHELVDAAYSLVAEVRTEEEWSTDTPFPITIVPDALTR